MEIIKLILSVLPIVFLMVFMLSCKKSRFNPNKPPKITQTLFLRGLKFKQNSSDFELDPSAILDQIVCSLNFHKETIIYILGHCFDNKDDSINTNISLERANNVLKYLISKNIDEKRIFIKGLGSEFPMASKNNDKDNLNSRIEILPYGNLEKQINFLQNLKKCKSNFCLSAE